MPFAHIRRGVLQDAGNQPDLVGRVHGDEGRSRTPDVVKTHGFTEFPDDSRADDIVDAAWAKRTALVGSPQAVMFFASEEARPNLPQVAREIGDV